MRKRYRNFMVSLNHAFSGIIASVKYEVHMRYHLFMALLAVIAGFYFQINMDEWFYLMLTITLVIFAELMNTALEANVDLATKEKKPEARLAKDVAAGAVLVASINALIVGWLLFGTKIFFH